MKLIYNKTVKPQQKHLESELETFKKHGVRVGSVVQSNYGDRYVVSSVKSWNHALPTLKGCRIGNKGELLSKILNIYTATKDGKIVVLQS